MTCLLCRKRMMLTEHRALHGNRHRPLLHFTKTSTNTYLALTVARMPPGRPKVTPPMAMVSWWNLIHLSSHLGSHLGKHYVISSFLGGTSLGRVKGYKDDVINVAYFSRTHVLIVPWPCYSNNDCFWKLWIAMDAKPMNWSDSLTIDSIPLNCVTRPYCA